MQATDSLTQQKAYADWLMAQADVIRWNELNEAMQAYVGTRPGWLLSDHDRSANAVGVSWRTDVFRPGQLATIKTHGGVLHITPTRWIDEDELIPVAAPAKSYVDQGTHVVHHIEQGGKVRWSNVIGGQAGRAKTHLTNLYARLGGSRLLPDRPLIGSGDLNINRTAEKALPPSQRVPWFPYTSLPTVADVVDLGTQGTHGGRQIDWTWYQPRDQLRLISAKVLPRQSSDHNAVLTVWEL